MGAPDKPFSELVGLFKSCIPRRPEPANVSRDFWMPDQSFRVCYECDSQFTYLIAGVTVDFVAAFFMPSVLLTPFLLHLVSLGPPVKIGKKSGFSITVLNNGCTV